MKAKTLTAGIIVVFSILACVYFPLPKNLSLSQPEPTAEQPIGSATGIRSLVEHALSGGIFSPLVDPEDMYNGDVFRITHGGESLLDFGDSVRLHLFNDTATGDVNSHCAPGSPREVSMLLEYGGFTGEVVEKGARATFRTPGGANIYVFGTQFFVTYDPESGKTYVGNFKGRVGIESGGVLLVVMPGNYRKALPGEAPQAERPINLDMEGFKARIRSELSPVKVSQGLDADIIISTFVTQTDTPRPTPSSTATTAIFETATITPSYTPTRTFTPTRQPCSIYSYDLLDNGEFMVVVQFREPISGEFTAIVDSKDYECVILPQYPNRLYCYGPYPPVGKVVDINFYNYAVLGEPHVLVCSMSFKVPFIPTITPTLKSKPKSPTIPPPTIPPPTITSCVYPCIP